GIRLPAVTPRVPYTTLFRSVEREHVGAVRLGICFAQALALLRRPVHRIHRGARRADDNDVLAGPTKPLLIHLIHRTKRSVRAPEDRKSTRLNSSHVKISYAV